MTWSWAQAAAFPRPTNLGSPFACLHLAAGLDKKAEAWGGNKAGAVAGGWTGRTGRPEVSRLGVGRKVVTVRPTPKTLGFAASDPPVKHRTGNLLSTSKKSSVISRLLQRELLLQHLEVLSPPVHSCLPCTEHYVNESCTNLPSWFICQKEICMGWQLKR